MNTIEHTYSLDSDPALSAQEDWTSTLHRLYEQGITRLQRGLGSPDQLVDSSERAFLASIGMSAQELYDFAEDRLVYGEPTFEEVLRITQLRRDYFLNAQQGQPSTRERSPNDFPPGHATLGGYPWLPRILAKADAKLRGELPPDLMFSCSGDRGFLRPLGIKPSEFLEKVLQYEGQEDRILEYVQLHGKGQKP